jgi:hypothetical protein
LNRRAWLGFPLAALALVGVCAWLRPYPFTAGDGILRYLPLIKAHTDSLLAGAPLRMLWGLGAGWNPAQSGEMGLAYLPYHLANLVARLLGHPLALLEASAWMHLAAASLVGWHLLPRRIEGAERAWICLLLMVLPGPFLLGLNWASYLAGYPWFLALALLSLEPCPAPGRRARHLLFTTAGFFLATHVQMFVLGTGLLLLAQLAEVAGRRDGAGLKAFVIALLPFAVPLAYLKMVSLHASVGWQQAWASKEMLIRGAQTLPVAFQGLACGNLLPGRAFQVFGDVSWRGIGVFFAPWLLLVLAEAAWRRRWWALAFWTLLGLLLGAKSAPFLSGLAVGPLQGFRWTWKLMLFVAPLSLLALLGSQGWQRLPGPWRTRASAGLAVLSLAVCLRGLPFILSHGSTEFSRLGAAAMVEDTRRVLAQCGLQEGMRIGLVDLRPEESLPVALMTLPGNGALLCGYESAHLFEPLDDAVASSERYGLTSQALISPGFLRRPDADRWLARIGIQALVAAGPLEGEGVRSARDGLGRGLWVRPVAGARSWTYPWASGPVELRRLPGGALRSLAASRNPPELINSRPMRWTRMEDGTWTGVPAGIPAPWWAAGGAVFVLALGYTWLLDRERGPADASGSRQELPL